MPTRIVIYEVDSYVTAELERRFQGNGSIELRWTPHFKDFLKSGQNHTTSIAILRCHHLPSSEFQELVELCQQRNLLVILERDDWQLECLLREAGVKSVLPFETLLTSLLTTLQRMLPTFAD